MLKIVFDMGSEDIAIVLEAIGLRLRALAKQFAPLLKFDRAAQGYGYPMDAQAFYEKIIKHLKTGEPFIVEENTNKVTLKDKTIPTYYQVREFGTKKQVRILYWWFYGYQHQCTEGQGAHHGDWERVMVILKEDRMDIAAVTFWQHDAHYTRISGPRDAPCTPAWTGRCKEAGFERSGTHPVVYVGKIAHGSYHDKNDKTGHGVWGCSYYGDFRNPKSDDDIMETWHNLISLEESELKGPKDLRISGLDSGTDQSPLPARNWWDEKNWIDADRIDGWEWGPDGVGTHPTQKAPTEKMHACEGSPAWDLGKKASMYDNGPGCYKSECLAGDDQASERCLKECKPGYTNHGLTCFKGGWKFWEWSVYGRLNSGNWYRYDYILPLKDVGLARRRSRYKGIDEWNLP
jgi:hypothetical protein